MANQISSFNNFLNGVTIRGVPIQQLHPGKVIWVNNSSVVPDGCQTGSDANKGSYVQPLATITKALTVCKANRGDIIACMPGHAETVSAASGLAVNVAGVAIVSLGRGSKRATITLDTANTATIAVSAVNVTFHRVLFVANFLNIAKCLALTTATDVNVSNCEFRDTSAVLNFVKAIATDSTDNHADGLDVDTCVMNATGTSAATTLINLLGATDRLVVRNNRVNVQGTTATTGALVLATSKALTTTFIDSNSVNSPLTTSAAGALIVAGTGGSGVVSNNYINIPAAASGILCTTGTGLGFDNNHVSRSAVDTSGLLLPAAST